MRQGSALPRLRPVAGLRAGCLDSTGRRMLACGAPADRRARAAAEIGAPRDDTMWQERGLDPITMEVVKNHLQAIVDEMSFTLERTCASQLIKDAQDFFCALCDTQGELIAVSITQPNALGTVPAVLRQVVDAFAGQVQPGDVYIVNDPYHGGTHLNDIHIMKPVFTDGVLLGYATSKAHHTDVGGRVPGSMAFDNTEIYQEGLRIPPLKLYDRGQPNETMWKLLELNVRYPDVLLADVHAQVTSLATGEAGLRELAATYGPETLKAYLDGLLAYGETLARAQIAEWPDGTAEFEDYCDDDGVSGNPVVFHAKVTKQGDQLFVDYAGTSPQVPAAINFPPFEAVSGVHFVVRCCLKGDPPNNGGLFRTVHVDIPSGSVLNPRLPAPCSERGLIVYRAAEVVIGALARLVPEGAIAGCEGGSYLMRFSGRTRRGEPFLCVDLVQGTWGARCAKDGVDGLADVQVNHTNTPVEVIEANFPIRVECHELVPDSGGPGSWRGGLAIRRSWRYLGQGEGLLRSRSDRQRFPPYGLCGGRPGAPSRLVLQRVGEAPVEMHGKAVVALQPGDLVELTIAAGGGWGLAYERDPARVLADARGGKVSIAHAREAYGVVIAEATLSVDAAASARLRAELSAGPSGPAGTG
ncbi:MAG: hydantoinase B/oxoprolinase family protein [Chloroflexi bacterium]|nr:hydantoinase B/oxoprolinase family protein [Chloroflexota bacterium]